jgi:hypothetical protein
VEVEVMDDPMYEKTCRSLSKVPLINQLQMAYQGREASCGWDGCMSTTGEVEIVTLAKSAENKLGFKIAGAYELGGVFVTHIDPDTAAAREPRLQVGARLLEINGHSVVFATQDIAARIIARSDEEGVRLTFQPTQPEEWRAVCTQHTMAKQFQEVVLAHEAQQAKKFKQAIVHYKMALEDEPPDPDPMLRCQALGGLGTVYFAMRQYNDSVRYHALEAR